MAKKEAAVQNNSLTMSERFTGKVLQEFGSNFSGDLQVTNYQKQLIQGYFISIDRALKIAEEARIRKNLNNKDKKYNNDLECSWNNVNLNDLSLDVVHYARMGLDMLQDNHLSPIPYKNNKTNKYDVNLMPGYNGIQYIAEKYAIEKPLDVTVELVYSTDIFKPIKKGSTNRIEGYEFEITNAFDRGKIVGGFGYIAYNEPEKNKLIIMSREEIEKRKPQYTSGNFWSEEGWFEQMALKTIKREVYSAKHIPRDPKKIDDSYQYMLAKEVKSAELEAQADIDEHANTVYIDTTATEIEEEAAIGVEEESYPPFQGELELELEEEPPKKTKAAKTKAKDEPEF